MGVTINGPSNVGLGEVSATATVNGQETPESIEQVAIPSTEVAGVSGQPVAAVTGSIGGTINIGNYSNMKVQVGFQLPCAPDVKSRDIAFAEGLHWAMEKFNQVVGDFKVKLSA